MFAITRLHPIISAKPHSRQYDSLLPQSPTEAFRAYVGGNRDAFVGLREEQP